MPDGSNLDAHRIARCDPGAHAVEFSKTAAPSREGVAFQMTHPSGSAQGRTGEYSADPRARGPGGGRQPDRTRKNSAPAARVERRRAKQPAPPGAAAA